MAETLIQKAQRLGMKPAGAPVASSTETLIQKAQRIGMSPANSSVAPFKYDVSSAPVVRKPIEELRKAAVTAQKTSDYSSSPVGLAVNTAKDLFNTFTSSEQGLGKSIQKIYGNQSGELQNSADSMTKTQQGIKSLIANKEVRGESAEDLKRQYNKNADILKNMGVDIKEEASLPSTGQVVGQIGGTALDLLTAGTYGVATKGAKSFALLPKVTKATSPTLVTALRETVAKPSGIFTAKGAGNIAKGGAVGYGYDVTQGLQNESSNPYTPRLGTAIGSILPGISAGGQTVKTGITKAVDSFSPSKFVEKRAGAFDTLLNSGVKTKNAFERSKAKGYDVTKTLALDDRFIPDVVDGKVVPDKAIIAVQGEAKPMAKLVRGVIDSEDKYINLEDFRQKALKQAENLKDQGAEYERVVARINADIESYKKFQNQAGEIPLSKVDDFKKAKYESINWNDPEKLSADRAIGKASRQIIDDNVTDISANDMNRELGKLYDAQEMLESLGGRAIQGGRLGKYFARGFGVAIGSKFGPAGSILGGVTADKMATIMQGAYFQNPIVKRLIGEIKSERPDIFKKAEELIVQRAKNKLGQKLLPARAVSPKLFVTPEGKVTKSVQEASDITAVESGKIKPPVPTPVSRYKPILAPKVKQVPEPYISTEKLPVIKAGSVPKPVKSNLPSVVGAPNVFMPQRRSQIQQTITKQIIKPRNDIPPTVPSKGSKVKAVIPKKK